jgi:hypothetical protein
LPPTATDSECGSDCGSDSDCVLGDDLRNDFNAIKADLEID